MPKRLRTGGDDPFDSMLGVVFWRRAEGVPNDEALRRIEGWILGQLDG